MDVSKLKHNVEATLATLVELPNGSLVTKTGCIVHVPESFRAKQLVSMGREISIIGFIALITPDGNYCTWKIPAMINMAPEDIRVVEVHDKSYYELHFPKGARVAKSLDLVVDNLVLYPLFEEVIARARSCWYYQYDDMASFYEHSGEFTGTVLYPTPSVFEMVIAQQARTTADRRVPLRLAIKSREDVKKIPFVYIPLRNVEHGATDTMAKLGGSNTAEGLDSAIVYPTETTNDVEQLMRV